MRNHLRDILLALADADGHLRFQRLPARCAKLRDGALHVRGLHNGDAPLRQGLCPLLAQRCG